MDPSMEVDQPFLQSVSIFLPRHSVHSFRRMPVQAVLAAAEQIDIDMVQQGGELHLPVPLCCFTYTVEPAWPALPTLRPARVELFRVLLV
jgi:hypothetical protein